MAKAIAVATAPLAAEAVCLLPLDILTVSPREARKTLDQAALRELAASIALKGVQEPLLVRPIIGGSNFEIVAGQRRYEASKLAGKESAPCIVREMTDEEAAEAALTSNLQREDLPPLEEALGFRQLLDRPGATVETVAAVLGKSASYVSRRLKLVDAAEPVREALKAGAIEVGHALELARLSEVQQKERLAELRVGYALDDRDDDDPDLEDDEDLDGRERAGSWTRTTTSVQELRRQVARSLHRDLNSAPFALDRADLGEVPCTECPKRSMNSLLLFNDLAGTDTCTDRSCFERKAEALIQIELDQAKKAKQPLLKVGGSWSNDKSVLVAYNVHIFKAENECPNGEAAIWVNGDSQGKHITICRDTKCKTHRGGSSNSYTSSSRAKASPGETAKAKAERKKTLDKVKAAKDYRAALVKAIAVTPVPDAAVDAVNLAVCVDVLRHTNGQVSDRFAETLGWDAKLLQHGHAKQLEQRLAGLKPIDRLRLALLSTAADDLAVSEWNVARKPEDLERVARLLKLDPATIAKSLEAGGAKDRAVGKSSPLPAAKAKGPAASGAPARPKAALKKAEPKKQVLSPAAKKRIAASLKKSTKAPAKKAAAKKKGGAK